MRLLDKDQRLKRLTAILTYTFSEIDVPTLSSLSGEPPASVEEALASLPFVTVHPGNQRRISFTSPVHRTYLHDRLQSMKAEVYGLMIKHYEAAPSSEKTSIELPILYGEVGRYDSLVEIMSPESIAGALSLTHSPSLALGNLSTLFDAAICKNDWDMVAYSSLAETALRFMIQRPPPLEDEIEALLKMGLLDDAMSAISTCGFPEDQLYLLARMSRVLSQKQIPVPESLLSLVDQVMERVPKLVDMGDRLFSVITDLFVAMPDIALSLINRLKSERTGSGSPKGMVSLMLRSTTPISARLIWI
jgi:hypothetical protein